jgi:hemerythrin
MAIEWRRDLEIGIAEIDDQHKELFRVCAEQLDACMHGKGSEEVGNSLRFLRDYVRNHFAAEERLQKKLGYPRHALHHMQHERFIADLAELEETLMKNGASVSLVIKTNRTMIDWMINHIGGPDREFGDFIVNSP